MKRILIAIACVLIAASCTKEQGEYLNLSVTSYTFGSSGNDTLRVGVSTNAGEWRAEADNAAISVENDGGEAVITMSPNESGEYVEGTVVFRAGSLTSELRVDQMPKSFVYDGTFVDLPLYAGAAMSPNGKYICYVTQNLVEGSTYEYKAYLLDTESCEIEQLEMPPYTGSYSNNNYKGISCLSDDARIIVFEDSGNAIRTMTIDGELYQVSLPSGYDNPKVSAMSGDGRIWVGFCQDNDNRYWPCKWTDGEPEILDSPEFKFDGVTPLNNGSMARGCSYDGSVIYGSEWDNFLLVYWKDGKMFNIGQEQCEIIEGQYGTGCRGLHLTAQETRMSADGRYIAVKFGRSTEGYPALVDTKTGQYKLIESVDGAAMSVAPDGTVFGGLPSYGVQIGVVFDFDAGSYTAFGDLMQQKYGITLSDNRMIAQVSADGNVLFGQRAVSIGGSTTYPNWFLRLDK